MKNTLEDEWEEGIYVVTGADAALSYLSVPMSSAAAAPLPVAPINPTNVKLKV